MDLKGGGIDGGEVETIYPVNTVTAKTAHLITICSKHSCRAGLAGSVTGKDERAEPLQGSGDVGTAVGGDLQQGICTHTFVPANQICSE